MKWSSVEDSFAIYCTICRSTVHIYIHEGYFGDKGRPKGVLVIAHWAVVGEGREVFERVVPLSRAAVEVYANKVAVHCNSAKCIPDGLWDRRSPRSMSPG